jgi:hypothetical protein
MSDGKDKKSRRQESKHLFFDWSQQRVKKNAEVLVCKERAKPNRYQINAIVNGGFVNVQLVAT